MANDTWHIVVADDDPDALRVLEEALHYYQRDAEVRSVRSGRACLEAVQASRPTLVIVDLAMPGLDGWRVLEALRHDPATADLPVAAVTAYHSANVAEDALAAGFDAFFPKPIDVLSFGPHLADLLRHGR